jgi:uncharacterized protein (TIGR01244 family)
MMRAVLTTVVASVVLAVVAHGQTPQTSKVTHESVPGISNFARLDTTIACGGATRPEAVPELKRMGFASIINVREASEAGADVDKEEAAAKAAGVRFEHVPFNIQNPAPDLVDRFIAAVTKPENQPAFVHCAAGGRAASLWMIKRVKVDRWDESRALEEANALGLNDRLRPWTLEYLRTHP